MKRNLFIYLFFCFALNVGASEVPTLIIQTQSNGNQSIPTASIAKITYDKTAGTTMYLHTQSGQQTILLSDIVRITLENMPEVTTLEQIEAADAEDAHKIMYNGHVYVIRDGHIFTMKGEKL